MYVALPPTTPYRRRWSLRSSNCKNVQRSQLHLFVLAGLALAGCVPGEAPYSDAGVVPDPGDASANLLCPTGTSEIQAQLLAARCAGPGCHGSTMSALGLDLVSRRSGFSHDQLSHEQAHRRGYVRRQRDAQGRRQAAAGPDRPDPSLDLPGRTEQLRLSRRPCPAPGAGHRALGAITDQGSGAALRDQPAARARPRGRSASALGPDAARSWA